MVILLMGKSSFASLAVRTALVENAPPATRDSFLIPKNQSARGVDRTVTVAALLIEISVKNAVLVHISTLISTVFHVTRNASAARELPVTVFNVLLINY